LGSKPMASMIFWLMMGYLSGRFNQALSPVWLMLIDCEKLRREQYSKMMQYFNFSEADNGGLICDKTVKLCLVSIGNLCYFCFIKGGVVMCDKASNDPFPLVATPARTDSLENPTHLTTLPPLIFDV